MLGIIDSCWALLARVRVGSARILETNMLVKVTRNRRLKPILHYALGLRFGIFKHSKIREKNATDLHFYPTHSVKALLHYALGLRFGNVCYQNATKT